MKYLTGLLLISSMFISASLNAQNLKKSKLFNWEELPALPDDFGYAGSFSGVSGNALIVAGGANFPDGGAPWAGSKKVWSDKIFVLDGPEGKWKLAGRLPMALGYGVSICFDDKLICIGGSNEKGHLSKVYAISYNGKSLDISAMVDLPKPLANGSGALIGNIVYVAGGLITPDAEHTSDMFCSFDLSKGNNGFWNQLMTWPGRSRMLAVSGVLGNSFYLFSGADLIKNRSGQLERVYLKDAFCYKPSFGWRKLENLPHAVVAAPSSAYTMNQESLLIFGGDDGKLAAEAARLKEKHPGFSDEILSYNVSENKWAIVGKVLKNIKNDAQVNPNASIWPAVTNSMVVWNGCLIFPGGEVRPAVRTPRVIMATPVRK